MHITKAKDYGFRTVFTVLHNPDDPHYVHADDSDHPAENVDGCPIEDAECVSNWNITEYIFNGEEQFKRVNGIRSHKEVADFVAEIHEQLVEESTVVDITEAANDV